MEIDIAEFGRTLSAARLERDLTQADIERETGVNRNVVSAIERGVYSASFTDKHRIIATHFGIPAPGGEDTGDDAVEEVADNAAPATNGKALEPSYAWWPVETRRTANGVNKETDSLITCLLAMEPLDQKQRERVMRSLTAWVDE